MAVSHAEASPGVGTQAAPAWGAAATAGHAVDPVRIRDFPRGRPGDVSPAS